MLEMKTADELVDPDLEARWSRRRATAREGVVLRQVLRSFVARPGPILADEIVAALPGYPGAAVREELVKLDGDDLIQLVDGRVEVAYPFSGVPTPFVVRLPGGAERFACCAIDALGMAAMLGHPIDVRSQCHHCGDPLELSVAPDGPGPEARDVVVWVGARCEGERRISVGL